MAALAEAVEIFGVGNQSGRIDLGGEAGRRSCGHAAALDDVGKALVARDLPAQLDRGLAVGIARMGPEDHAVGQRVAAGDAIQELGHGIVTAAGAQGDASRQGGGHGGQTDDEIAAMDRVHGQVQGVGILFTLDSVCESLLKARIRMESDAPD